MARPKKVVYGKTIFPIESDFVKFKKDRDDVLTEERVSKIIPRATEYVSFWREYPDMLIDFMKQDSKFEFFFYQRLFLRAAMRHRYFFGTFNCGRV